ncbi:beta-mannosidase [Clostridium sp. USBA 49]|uniref:beta-mannosidase n=1 Tax=Clostridium sp. USBA 49 TaxID=1881060 RepID=UPI0009994E7D|nr:glycoside hydrolase family 2 protein [Clostridium sp. USBA 49]SKA73825.1 beta-mannosidase [Clostridium sp. USBA 49]
MIIEKLNDNWQMRNINDEEYINASVPGSVYSDLLKNNKMEDPYYRDNELKALKLMDQDYEYKLIFNTSKKMLNSDEIMLHFDGLDTLADIYLNENHIAYVNNMHRIWEFEVKRDLKEEKNELKIVFHSPTKFIKEADKKQHIGGSSDAMKGFPQIRKAHCMFGWDWGPRLPDMGIWREVSLLGISKGRIENVYIKQEHKDNKVILDFQIDMIKTKDRHALRFHDEENKAINYGYYYEISITNPDGIKEVYSGSPKKIVINNPKLWWPNGYGNQPLYKIEVALMHSKEKIDTWKKRIGLRTLTVHIEKDKYGESFAHEVNGVKVFAMGADYIPEDCILSRVTPERTYNLLKQCKDAHFNSVRVWGGGNYPYDAFYDACDELGLMVWQDFMFACANYNLTDEFEENIRAEFIDNIKRIRNHPSLALWCGNNEMEQFVSEGNWELTPKLKSDYIKIYEYIIPKILKEYDPETFYWPASPSSGGGFDNPNDENRGDVHYWDVWHGNKPFTEYRKFFFRYVSEFGFQSFPSLKTVETFTKPEDRNIFSYIMEKHQRNNGANSKIMSYMGATYLYPNDFNTLLYASQLLQAEAIRYGVEHFRRNRGRCMGTIYWQLNDCWPVASWASIDYFGRWKALHYYAKRFFAPLMLSCKEEGLLTQDPNVNAEPYEVKKSIQLCVSNESMHDEKVTVRWALRNNKAEIKKEDSCEVIVKKLTSNWLDIIDMQEASLYEDYVSYEMLKEGEIISEGTVIFSIPKHFKFIDPKLTYKVEGDEIVIFSESYAKNVEIINKNDDMLLEDNYFDMNGGERRIKILKGKPEEIKIRSVYDIR